MTKELTVANLLKRTVKDGDCRLWTGYASKGTIPMVSIKGVTHSVRRYIFEKRNGKLSTGLQVGVTCGNCLCISCLIARTCSEAMTGLRRSPAQRVRYAIAKRRASRLSEQDITDIRASRDRAASVGRQYGISDSYVSSIRKGIARIDYSNPFLGLGAR